MLIPYNTDAPIYHWPIATVAMIVLNVLVFACGGWIDPEFLPQQNVWALQYGMGLRPWQWVTSNFVHGGVGHLLGNMFCLWGLSLIVEGKIGWWKYLAAFFGIGTLQCALEQTLALWHEPNCSFGASAIVFGMVAMALVWAPKNDLSCLVLLGRPFLWEAPVWLYAAIVLGLEAIILFLTGPALVTAALHLMGAGMGFVLATVMLRKKWVDCENWDLFSVWSGRHELTDEERRRVDDNNPQRQGELQSARQQRSEAALAQMRAIIADEQPTLAYAAHGKMQRQLEGWSLPEADFFQLIAAFKKKQLWAESVPVMVEYLRTYRERASVVRLLLAQVLVDHEQRAAQALAVLAKIPPNSLNPAQQKAREQIESRAQTLRRDDPVEFQPEDW